MVAALGLVHRWDGSLDSVASLWHQAEPFQPIAPVLSFDLAGGHVHAKKKKNEKKWRGEGQPRPPHQESNN